MNAIRDAELCNEKPPKALHLDANRTGLIVKDEETTAALSLDSDLALYQAMMRDSCYYGSCWTCIIHNSAEMERASLPYHEPGPTA